VELTRKTTFAGEFTSISLIHLKIIINVNSKGKLWIKLFLNAVMFSNGIAHIMLHFLIKICVNSHVRVCFPVDIFVGDHAVMCALKLMIANNWLKSPLPKAFVDT